MPCCMSPTTEYDLHFATLDRTSKDIGNADGFRRARLSFADRQAYEAEAATSTSRAPYCAECKQSPTFNFQLSPHVGMQLKCLDQGRVFDDAAIRALTM